MTQIQDPDPHQNLMDPKHRIKPYQKVLLCCLINIDKHYAKFVIFFGKKTFLSPPINIIIENLAQYAKFIIYFSNFLKDLVK